jgi:hypothetical protein
MDKAEIYPFYRANIHERRYASQFFRALPLAFFFLVCAGLTYGVLQNELVLLSICAIFNLALWLFITTTALFGIAGAYKVMMEVEQKKAQPSPEPTKSAFSTRYNVNSDGVVHLIVLPNYKEDESILDETLTCLQEAEDSRSFYVTLAMEAREGPEAQNKAERLKEKFKCAFADVIIATHPTDLKQEHLDESVDLEVPGKASNLKWQSGNRTPT